MIIMRVTIQQIADLAGVSRGTVDRVLHDRGRVDPEVAQKILDIARSSGYTAQANSKKAAKSRRIGIITFLSERVFMSEINRGIEQAAEELSQWGIEVLVEKCTDLNAAEQAQAIDRLSQQDISGLAIMPVDSDLIRAKLNTLSDERHIPIITFNTDIVGTRRLCFLGMDNKRSGQVAAGLMGMLTQGSGTVLVLTGSFANNAYSLRVDGFIEELKTSYPSMKIAGVQCAFDNKDETEVMIESALLNSSGISGILMTSAGQDGVEAAFRKLNLKSRPYVILYDVTPCTKNALNHNVADFVISQDLFHQGYNAAYALANILVKNQYPAREYLYTDIDIKTKYNISA